MERLEEEMEINSEISTSKRKLEVEIESYKDSLEEVKQQLQLVSQRTM